MTTAPPSEARPFTVDPESLRHALAALDDVTLAMTHTRARLRDVLADAPTWAADGDLCNVVTALVEALSTNAQRAEAEAAELASSLGLAAARYGDADQQAVYRAQGGDAPGRGGR